MAENDETIIDVQESYSKLEQYIEENKKPISIILGAIVVIVGGYFAWKYLYVADLETEAQKKLFIAESYFQRDSLNQAINGDGQNSGFLEIADNYGVTKSGNLAEYYLGISYLKKGEFQNAIDHLGNFSSDDQIIGPMAKGAIGDAHLELGHVEDAIKYYLEAADQKNNDFTSPVFLKKAAMAYEENKNYEDAIKVYERIKTEHPNTQEGKDIDKYIARAKILSGTAN